MKLLPITEQLTNSPNVTQHELARSVCGSMLDLYKHTHPTSPWLGYLCEIEGNWVGTCAFKSEPQRGRVEIAYFTFPECEGQGYATAMAAELLAIAKADDPQLEIFAQTLPTENASTRILKKLGFQFLKDVDHPEDGLVWEWSIK